MAGLGAVLPVPVRLWGGSAARLLAGGAAGGPRIPIKHLLLVVHRAAAGGNRVSRGAAMGRYGFSMGRYGALWVLYGALWVRYGALWVRYGALWVTLMSAAFSSMAWRADSSA